jgi:hypothetical protein
MKEDRDRFRVRAEIRRFRDKDVVFFGPSTLPTSILENSLFIRERVKVISSYRPYYTIHYPRTAAQVYILPCLRLPGPIPPEEGRRSDPYQFIGGELNYLNASRTSLISGPSIPSIQRRALMQAELSGGSALAALGGDPLPDTPIGLGGVLVLLPALPFTLPFTLFRDNIIHRKDLLGGRGGVRSRRTQERRQRKG